jgi:hypothetical protein
MVCGNHNTAMLALDSHSRANALLALDPHSQAACTQHDRLPAANTNVMRLSPLSSYACHAVHHIRYETWLAQQCTAVAAPSKGSITFYRRRIIDVVLYGAMCETLLLSSLRHVLLRDSCAFITMWFSTICSQVLAGKLLSQPYVRRYLRASFFLNHMFAGTCGQASF